MEKFFGKVNPFDHKTSRFYRELPPTPMWHHHIYHLPLQVNCWGVQRYRVLRADTNIAVAKASVRAMLEWLEEHG